MTYGACFGDAAGVPYEFGKLSESERLHFNQDIRKTAARGVGSDDSVMTCAVAKTLTEYADIDHSLVFDAKWKSDFKKTLVRNMTSIGRLFPSCGYGGSFMRWVMLDAPAPYGSWGNGSAMRVSPVGWFADSEDECMEIAKLTADVSHDHIEGERGAQAIALAVLQARLGNGKDGIRESIERNINVGYGLHRKDFDLVKYDIDRTVDEIIKNGYEFEVSCQKSVPEAICAVLDDTSVDYESTIRNEIRLDGDSDTQAAMGGGVAEALYGMPDYLIEESRDCLRKLGDSGTDGGYDLLGVMDDFYRIVVDRKRKS